MIYMIATSNDRPVWGRGYYTDKQAAQRVCESVPYFKVIKVKQAEDDRPEVKRPKLATKTKRPKVSI